MGHDRKGEAIGSAPTEYSGVCPRRTVDVYKAAARSAGFMVEVVAEPGSTFRFSDGKKVTVDEYSLGIAVRAPNGASDFSGFFKAVADEIGLTWA